MEDWRARYLRKVLDFVGAPEGVDLETVTTEANNDPGYHYSSYTFEDPSFKFSVSWIAPEDDTLSWHIVPKGTRIYREIEGDEVAKLIGSFDA